VQRPQPLPHETDRERQRRNRRQLRRSTVEFTMPISEALLALFEVDQHSLTWVAEQRQAGEVESSLLSFRSQQGETAQAWLMRPTGNGPHPAILYIHAHGARYDIGARELVDGRPALVSPLGLEFVKRGYVSLALEMPAFGTRQAPDESARSKALLWRGRSLAGQMLGEQFAAFEWLSQQDWVDPARIGVFGLSMGATLGYWLAAVEPRISCAAHLCCYADFNVLIDSGAHDLHGIYLTIPGLLNVASNGEIAGLIAPRPQFIGIGDADPLTPPAAVDAALRQTRAAYQAAGVADRLIVHQEPFSGHVETPAMRQAMLEFFGKSFGQSAPA
jgi:dienelactone hydrolase